jgi:pimeloyl-ACP methyl ester carboxylesterase
MYRLCFAIVLLTAARGCHQPTGETRMPTNGSAPAPRTGTLAVNGLHYYYELNGSGEPLLLLHGGLQSIDAFRPVVLPALADRRQVIAVDLHGHGRTALGDRAFSVIDQGDDMAEIIKQLGFTQVDVVGYSLGAAVALRLALQHPQAVRRLVLVSCVFSTEGFYPEMLPQQAAIGGAMADMMKDTPMYKSYIQVAPHPEDFPKLLDRLGDYMRKSYNWADEVKKLQAQTLLVFGDGDMFRPEHMVQFYQLLGGGLRDAGWRREHRSKNQLAILPDVTHYDMFLAPQLVPTVQPFLDGKTHTATWADQVKK